MALPWTLGRLPMMAAGRESESTAETTIAAKSSNNGMSSGVLVIVTLPFKTQESDQSTKRSSEEKAISVTFGISKNSVVNGRNSKGVKKRTIIRTPVITLSISLDS